MLVVIALGGNALLRRGQPMTPEAQRRNVAKAATAIAEIAKEHRLVVTHGNGPQIGLLAEQTPAGSGQPRVALDVLGAETQGMIGYIIESELASRLPGREIATLITQVVVDPSDALLASELKADALLMLTDVSWVCTEWGSTRARGIRRAMPAGLRRYRFLEGSMGPKVEAA